MTGNEVDVYLLRAVRNVYNTDMVSSVEVEKLLSLIDEKYVLEFKHWYQHTGPGRNSHMDDHLRSILTALAGPHGRTLLKVLEINKGGNHDNRGNEQILDASTAEPFPR